MLVALCLLGNKSRVEAGNTFPNGGALRPVTNSSLRGLVGLSIRLHFYSLASGVIASGFDGLWLLNIDHKDPTAIGGAIEDLLRDRNALLGELRGLSLTGGDRVFERVEVRFEKDDRILGHRLKRVDRLYGSLW